MGGTRPSFLTQAWPVLVTVGLATSGGAAGSVWNVGRLKNGWLPLTNADDNWQINSIGWVSGDGRNYLMAVLTTGNPTEQYGIDTIDQLSAIVWGQMQ